MNTYEWLVDTLNKTLSYPINRIHELLRGYKEMMGSCSVDYVCLNHFLSFFSRRERRVFHAENAEVILCELCVVSFIFSRREL
ncbi:MAG: hypothetical protein IT216_10665 [Saprospiraceae bacterium]|nr:hypothetical protein [Candidatus Parvibacillus calidus]MCC7149669.1 hypothetical protein [Saprospiraceae bacterium]